MDKNDLLKKILILLKNFTDKKTKGREFEKRYMDLWKYIRNKNIIFEEEIEDILNEIWCDVDALVLDKKLLSKLKKESAYTKKEFNLLYFNEQKLRKKVRINLNKLNRFIKK